MITLAKENIEVHYQSRLFSLSTLCCVLIYFGIIVIPFVLAFASDNFWVMIVQEEMQMDITYNGNYYVQSTRNNSLEIFTNLRYEQAAGTETLITNSHNGGNIKYQVIDSNSDGITDRFIVDLSIGGSANLLQQMIILLPIKCSFPKLHFSFNSFLYLQFLDVGNGISQIQVYGTSLLYQVDPIPYDNFEQLIDQNITISSYDTTEWLNKLIIEDATSLYQFRPEYSVRQIQGNDQFTTYIHIDINNDKNQFIDKWMNLLGTIKLAWLQYMSIFLFVWVFGRELLLFIFKFRLLQSYKTGIK